METRIHPHHIATAYSLKRPTAKPSSFRTTDLHVKRIRPPALLLTLAPRLLLSRETEILSLLLGLVLGLLSLGLGGTGKVVG